jgi:structural maintenance of chromosome 3 (chondroitin sulfate proteoglycan 6)
VIVIEVDQRVTTLMAELETLEADRAKDRDTLETFQQEVRRAAKEVLGAEESLVQKERERTDLLTLISNLKASVKSLEEELKVDLYKGLSAAEKASIESLTTELSQLNKDIIESSAARASLEKEKSQIENRLTENLLPRKEQLEAALTSMELGDQSEENQQRLSVSKDLSAAVASVEDIAQRQASSLYFALFF